MGFVAGHLTSNPWRSSFQRYGVAPLGHSKVQARQQVQGQQKVMTGFADQAGELPQHPLHLSFLGQASFPPPVALFHGSHGFDEDRGPAVGHIVNDASYSGTHLRFDQQHEPSVALGDDSLLHQLLTLEPAQTSLHNFVQVVLDAPGFMPQLSKRRTSVVQYLPGRTDGGSDGSL